MAWAGSIALNYARCVVKCTAQAGAMSLLTGDCFSLKDSAQDCALDCFRPGGGRGSNIHTTDNPFRSGD